MQKEWHVDRVAMDEDACNLNIWTNAKTGNEKMPGHGLDIWWPV